MVKRYEPAQNGGMMEFEGGKYFHERDVDALIKEAMRACNIGISKGNDADNAARRISIKIIEGWKGESI